MLEEMVIEEIQDTEQLENEQYGTMPLEEMLRLVSRLEHAGMLQGELTPPGEWILWSEVPVPELVTMLQEQLSKTGWRRIVEAMHRHNRQTTDARWELSRTEDFLAAVERALAQQASSNQEASPGMEDWTPTLHRQVKSLMETQLKPAGITAWLLSPRALVARLSAKARQARTETQIESAVSEAALHAARMVGTDAERDVALTRVEQLREQLGTQLEVYCDEQGLPLPRPYSREEAHCLHLLNAYFVALAEAEGEIARRGAALARRQIALEGQRAEVRMDGQLLPGLLEAQRDINPLREAVFRERVRHRFALWVGGLLGAVGGSLWGVVESVSDVLITGIARHAVVVAPALLLGLLTLVVQTMAYSGPFTLDVVLQFLARATWNGALGLGGTILVYGCWQYYSAKPQEGEQWTPSVEER